MTSKHKLLIVDDELDHPSKPSGQARRSTYESLQSDFDLVFADGPSSIESTLREGNIDAVLLDFILEGWGIEAVTVLKLIDNQVPTGLISHHWTPNFAHLRSALESFDVSRLFTWEELSSLQGRHIVSFWMTQAIRKHQKLELKALGPDEPFRVLHLSDLQFGSPQPETFQSDTRLTVGEIARRWTAVPDLLAITGDISEHGLPLEFSQAGDWIQDFGRKLGSEWSEKAVALVPGNHDVTWPLALSPLLNAKERVIADGAEINPGLQKYAFAPFREFAEGFGRPEDWSEARQYWVSGRRRADGIILFGINTSHSLDRWGVPTRQLDDDGISGLFEDLHNLKRGSPNALIIGLMHHPLGEEDSIRDATRFKRNLSAELGTVMLLTGHVHADLCSLVSGDGGGYLQVVGPTFTKLSSKRPEDTRRGFNLIECRREDGVVMDVEVQPYTFGHARLTREAAYQYRRRPDGMFETR